jgi:hypothetical protein
MSYLNHLNTKGFENPVKIRVTVENEEYEDSVILPSYDLLKILENSSLPASKPRRTEVAFDAEEVENPEQTLDSLTEVVDSFKGSGL